MNDRDLQALVEDYAERLYGDPLNQIENVALNVMSVVLEDLGVPAYRDASEASAEVLLFEEKIYERAEVVLEDLQKRDDEDD